MSRVLTFSRVFPSYHPKAGQPTYFVEKVLWSLHALHVPFHHWKKKVPLDFLKSTSVEKFDPKFHTIRAGHRWKVGDKFSPRVWSGKPYNSKQIQFAPDIQVKKVWDFSIILGAICIGDYHMNGECEGHHELLEKVAINDGLNTQDLINWFQYPKPFDGQIISWSDSIEY